jgi:hypothetical protein
MHAAPRSIFIRFHTDKPVQATPYQMKGAILRDYPDHPIVPFINGSYRGQLRYPRVQVKVLREQLCILGIGEGYEAVRSFQESLGDFQIEEQQYAVLDRENLDVELHLDRPAGEFQRYKFITPWVALDRRSVVQYGAMLTRERVAFLNRLLVRNLVFLADDLGFHLPYIVTTRLKLHSLSPQVVEQSGTGSFKGYFTSNMDLPDYIGLGHGITKGLGTIIQM